MAGAEVVCDPQSEDKYERILAYCAAEGRDLGEAQVRAGLALAYRRYSDRYVAAEEAAKRARAGAWAYELNRKLRYSEMILEPHAEKWTPLFGKT